MEVKDGKIEDTLTGKVYEVKDILKTIFIHEYRNAVVKEVERKANRVARDNHFQMWESFSEEKQLAILNKFFPEKE